MAKRRTWRWVTRDVGFVKIWAEYKKPELNSYGEWWNLSSGAPGPTTVAAFTIHTLFGLTIPTDHPVKVEFTAKVVE